MRNVITASILAASLLGCGTQSTLTLEGYYSSAHGKTGRDLKDALHTIIDGHEPISYRAVREAFASTDAACPPDTARCGLIQLLYLDDTRTMDQANDGSGHPASWDREHVWPSSRGFRRAGQDGYTDLHHLRPADRNLNGAHSNYGYDNGGTTVMDTRADYTRVPTDASIDEYNHSFEPPDRAKGQVARMIFYMAVRYEPGDDARPEDMPDLQLRDTNERVREPWIGDLCTLLAWHREFRPTEFERRRNDRVMEIQGNRNPFIDRPAFAILIWGDSCGER